MNRWLALLEKVAAVLALAKQLAEWFVANGHEQPEALKSLLSQSEEAVHEASNGAKSFEAITGDGETVRYSPE